MVREILRIRTDNGFGDNDPYFHNIELDEYEFSEPRMGMPSLKATLMYGECLDSLWTKREYVEFRGERYYIRHTPTSSKSNTDARYKHEIEFRTARDEILGNVYFYDAVYGVSTTKDKPCSNSTKFTFYGTIREFVDRLNCAFRYAGVGDSILNTKTSLTTDDVPVGDGYCAMLDPFGDYDSEKSWEFSFEDKFIWEAISESYSIHEIPFEFRGKTMVYGAVPQTVDHVFKYGHDDALLSVTKTNANAKVVNRITMEGSSENIPYYYPNETEYGHISIVADTGNKVLTKDMIEVKNMNMLLSRLSADSTAILRKETLTSESNAKVKVTSLDKQWNNLGWSDCELKKEYAQNFYFDYGKPGWVDKLTLTIMVHFEVTGAGYVQCDNIEGYIYLDNVARGDSNANLISSITPVSLIKESTEEGESEVNLTGNLDKKDKSVGFGNLSKGNYLFRFTIDIQSQNSNCAFFKLKKFEFSGGTPTTTDVYYWEVGSKRYSGLGSLGVTITGADTEAIIGDGFRWEASGRMPFQTNLMPSKYRESLGDERFYNAENNTYKDPDTNEDYVFPNPYVKGAPSEYIYRNEDIKPTIEGIKNYRDFLIGSIADVAYDSDDNDFLTTEATEESDKNDSSKYQHSFFYIKLHKFDGPYGFDLFKHISQTGEMTIQMTSGPCNGCKFKVQAVRKTDEAGWYYYENPVQTTSPLGEIVDGSYAEKVREDDIQSWQQNTQTKDIWICVQKDASTFGMIVPNKVRNYRPNPGDTFNITGIELPESYILAAEKRLEEEGIRYMADNNEEKFTFGMSASRIFFAERPDVLASLNAYSKVKVEYDGKIYELFVNEITVKCTSGEPLPDIQANLVDSISVGQGFLQSVAERMQSLIANAYTSGGALGGSGGGMSTAMADRRYLIKQRNDRTPYRVSTDMGFEVGEYVSGVSGGYFMRNSETGQTMLEVDKLYVRMKAIFEELEIVRVNSIGGKQIITPGGAITVSFVEELDTVYRCWFKNKEDDKGVTCRFEEGDLAYSKEFNIGAGYSGPAQSRYYWRYVDAVDNEMGYIDLSKTDCDTDSDIPQTGDTICQLGNKNEDGKDRQSAIIMSTVDDAFAPSVTLLDGIDDYTLEGKSVVEYGVDKSKNPPEPFFHCYGRMFVGPRSRKSYIEFSPSDEQIIFKGKIVADSTIGDKTLEEHLAGIEVGVRNLIADSASLAVTGTIGLLKLTQPLKKDEWYTFRIERMYTYNGQTPTEGTIRMDVYNGSQIAAHTLFSVADGYVTFQPVTDVSVGGTIRIYPPAGFTPPFWMYNLSLVVGTVPLMYWQAAPEDVDKAISKYDYLTEAMRNSTTIDGGLVLTSVVSCGDYDKDTDTQHTMSGLNGIFMTGEPGGGVALWTGGDMIDLISYYTWSETSGKWEVDAQKIQQSGINNWSYIRNRIAKGVDRMDGSGYRAKGNLWWDADGNTTFVGNINARGTFGGIRRKQILTIDNSNYHDFLIGTMDKLEAMESVMYFKRALRSPITIPDASVEYLGESIVIIVDPEMESTEGYVVIRLEGKFYESTAGAAEPKTALNIQRGNMVVLECQFGATTRWVYKTGAAEIPTT